MIGNPEQVAKKIIKHSNALGGISRFTFQIDNAGLSHKQLLDAVTRIGKDIMPVLNDSEQVKIQV